MAKEKDDVIQLIGTVTEGCKGNFKVKLDDSGNLINATVSGKIRTNSVRIVIGDKVTVEVSVYDTSRGRIVFRNKEQR